jgi:hypothetical protein
MFVREIIPGIAIIAIILSYSAPSSLRHIGPPLLMRRNPPDTALFEHPAILHDLHRSLLIA